MDSVKLWPELPGYLIINLLVRNREDFQIACNSFWLNGSQICEHFTLTFPKGRLSSTDNHEHRAHE